MIPSRGPTIVTVRPITSKSGGINCCCCRCCSCLNLQFLKTEAGVLKILELLLGSLCQSLALNYGLSYSETIGMSYQSFLTSVAWCIMTVSLLLFCYIFSEKSCSLIKQSLFETVFNSVACFTYFTSGSYVGYILYVFMKPIQPYYQAYPAISAACMVGGFVGLIHGFDAYKSYRYYKGYR